MSWIILLRSKVAADHSEQTHVINVSSNKTGGTKTKSLGLTHSFKEPLSPNHLIFASSASLYYFTYFTADEVHWKLQCQFKKKKKNK